MVVLAQASAAAYKSLTSTTIFCDLVSSSLRVAHFFSSRASIVLRRYCLVSAPSFLEDVHSLSMEAHIKRCHRSSLRYPLSRRSTSCTRFSTSESCPSPQRERERERERDVLRCPEKGVPQDDLRLLLDVTEPPQK
jgi:hypothetical protein